MGSSLANGRYDWLRGDYFDDAAVRESVTGPAKLKGRAAEGNQWYVPKNLDLTVDHGGREFENTASTPAH